MRICRRPITIWRPVGSNLKVGLQRCAIHGPRIVALEENDLFEKMSVLPHPFRDECFDLDVHGLALGAISPTSEVARQHHLADASNAMGANRLHGTAGEGSWADDAPKRARGSAPAYALGIVTGGRKRLGGSVSASE